MVSRLVDAFLCVQGDGEEIFVVVESVRSKVFRQGRLSSAGGTTSAGLVRQTEDEGISSCMCRLE